MGVSITKTLPYWTKRLPRSKLSVEVDEAPYANNEELEGMGKFALTVQYEKREKLLQQMVGTFYPGVVGDEMIRLKELLAKLTDETTGQSWRTTGQPWSRMSSTDYQDE